MSDPGAGVFDLGTVLKAIDAVNAQDPRLDDDDEQQVPKELLYGQRMTACLNAFMPDASVALQIACRAQHIARWRWPRSGYAEGRAGYRSWRRDHYTKHAELAAELVREHGGDEALAERVALLVGKKDRTTDAESQALEDVACLVFLEHEFAAFAAKHERDKLISIVRNTWKKMSEDAHAAALALDLPEHLAALVGDALK